MMTTPPLQAGQKGSYGVTFQNAQYSLWKGVWAEYVNAQLQESVHVINGRLLGIFTSAKEVWDRSYELEEKGGVS